MNKILSLFLSLFILVNNLQAGDGEYAVTNIPPNLLKSANIIKRKEEIRFEILNAGNATEYRKYVLTVLNDNGNEHALLTEGYDKLISIESITGALYDAAGKKIKSIKKSDIEDLSGTGGSLITDIRIKHHNFYCKSYPYTVEYEVEIKFNFTMFFPGWTPIEDQNYAVQESKLTVVCPVDYKFRFKTFNYSEAPQIQTKKSLREYTWEVKDLPAVVWEFAHPEWNEVTPTVLLGPEQFEAEGYKGNMQSWQDYGKFVYALKAGRDQLPDEIKLKVHQLTDHLPNPRQKITRLYEFMQGNTHYISVQLGIGGWQPFDANYVASKKYGDCKALSNYMYSLLKEAGIKSYYTLISAGADKKYLVADFPSSQFNHVILCVPLEKDSVWLECTDQNMPAGYLGDFTDDRYALLIDESGGKLVRTPKYGVNENVQTRKISANINEEGTLKAAVATKYRALQQERLFNVINELSKDKQLEYLKTAIHLQTYDVINFDFKVEKSPLPIIIEALELEASNYAQVSGRRLFINPNILNRSRTRLETEEDRKYDINLTLDFRDIDSVEIKIPAGFIPESIPREMKIISEFGKYVSLTRFDGDRIIYYRLQEEYSGKFPVQKYAELVEYYEQLYKADQAQIVLVKKDK
ncbi:MAG TPA: DUF3857 domain-containing protein [Puia sp.]|nr:DUF3857 domain-containing protein [Puia sp.]